VPSSSVRRLLPCALAATVLLAAAASPAKATLIAEGEDPVGDAAAPGTDLVAAGLGYDPASGQLVGAIRLAGEPTEPAAVVALVAARSLASGCDQGPAFGFAAPLTEFGARWLRVPAPGVISAEGYAAKTGTRGAVQRFEVVDDALKRQQPECLTVTIANRDDPAMTYDAAGPFRLVPQPGLSVRFRALPDRVRTGRTYRVRVTVSNPGLAATGRVRVKLAQARGLSARRRAVTVRSVAAGKSRTATFSVRLSERAWASTELEVTATAGKLTAKAQDRVRVTSPKRRSTRKGGGTGRVRSCVKYFPDLSGETGGSLGLVPCVR